MYPIKKYESAENGEPGQIRTGDLRLRRPSLYPLSYRPAERRSKHYTAFESVSSFDAVFKWFGVVAQNVPVDGKFDLGRHLKNTPDAYRRFLHLIFQMGKQRTSLFSVPSDEKIRNGVVRERFSRR